MKLIVTHLNKRSNIIYIQFLPFQIQAVTLPGKDADYPPGPGLILRKTRGKSWTPYFKNGTVIAIHTIPEGPARYFNWLTYTSLYAAQERL